jgi:hypothetical protein
MLTHRVNTCAESKLSCTKACPRRRTYMGMTPGFEVGLNSSRATHSRTDATHPLQRLYGESSRLLATSALRLARDQLRRVRNSNGIVDAAD